jgi:hypothetical protein
MEAPARPRHSGLHAGAAKWLIVLLLAVIATCLLIEAGAGSRPVYADATSASAGNMIAVAGKVTADTYGLYLVDLKNGTIMVYEYLSGKRQLRLMAARTYQFDVQLDEYNTEPSPREIKKLVQQNKRLGEKE